MSPENANIFQADDDSGWFGTLKKHLEKHGHHIVISTTSVQEALEKIKDAKEQGVTVAILDNRMPVEGDGEKIAEALRLAIPEIKIISLCGQFDKPEWADFHLNKGAFSWETATKDLPELIRTI